MLKIIFVSLVLVMVSCGKKEYVTEVTEVTEITELTEIVQVYREEFEPIIIYPCGDLGGFQEILIKFSDTKIMCYFKDGSKEFLTILEPGLYVTTDYKKCSFEITEDYEIIDESM